MTTKYTISIFVLLAGCASDDDGDSGGATSAMSQSASGSPTTNDGSGSGVDGSAGTETSNAMTGAEESDESAGPECNPSDTHEPNEDEASAASLPEFSDQCDVDSSLSGVVAGDGDVDWLSYRGGTNDLICSSDPSVDVVASDSVRFCQYVDCIEGEPTAGQCPNGTTADTSDDGGRPGCCAEGPSVGFVMTVGCSSDAEVFMRVDHGAADVCTTYSVSYHF